MQLVDQSVGEQVVPGGHAAETDDVAPVAVLQLGYPCLRVPAAYDLGVRLPGRGLIRLDGVGDDDLVESVVQPGDLALDLGGRRVVGKRWPITSCSAE
jgi:hypothetical protein